MNDERDCLNYLIAYYQKQVEKNNLNYIHSQISPIYVGFKITEKCNQNCKHCWAGKSKTTKSYDDIYKAMEKISVFNIMHFTITGGEPLIHHGFIKILKISVELFPIVEVFSNGQDLKEEAIKEIAHYLRKTDYFQISLDGMRASYKMQRGIDSFDKVVSNIQLLKKNKINVRINMTVTDINVNDIISVYNLVNDLNVNVFSITPVFDLRKGKQLRNIKLLEKYVTIVTGLQRLHSKNENDLKLRVFMPIEIKSRKAKLVEKNIKNNYLYFNDNILHWTIDAEGEIYNFLDHFIHKDLYIGNIYDDSIPELKKRNLEVQQKIGLRNLSNCKCAQCNKVKSCMGGNYINIYPNINNPDERCEFNG